MLMRPPRKLDIMQARWLIGVVAVLAGAFIFVEHGNPDRLVAGLAGALLATFTYAPIQRIRVSPERATTIGTITTLASIVVVVVGMTGLSNVASAVRLAASFVVAATIFFGMIVSDRMRSIWRESP
jgi:hypothetical protein